MNILILRNLFIFIFIYLGATKFCSINNDANLQKVLTENPSIVNNIPKQDKNTC